MVHGIAAFAANLVVYAILARVLSGTNRFFLFLSCGSISGCLLIGFEFRYQPSTTIESLSGILLYACLCELLIVLMAINLSSISASIVFRLYQTPMTKQQIDQEYSSDVIVLTRVQRLLGAGFVYAEGNDLVLTSTGLRIVRLFQAARWFFGHA
jgi:hypothetical protein